MNFIKSVSGLSFYVLMMSVYMFPTTANIAHAQSASVGKTGLPIPRFVSLKSNKANMRVGPGSKFAVDWQYVKQGLPLEIIQEFDNWRKVRDAQGNEGWMLHSLLSGKRTAIIKPWETDKANGLADLRSKSDTSAKTIARIEPGVVAQIDYCDEKWCHLTFNSADGYISKDELWGVYPDELIEE